jgi:hypothetical protein
MRVSVCPVLNGDEAALGNIFSYQFFVMVGVLPLKA